MLKEKFLFERDFLKSVFLITLPIALQNVISCGVSTMDSIMLGRLGDVAVSAANLGGQPFFFLMITGAGLSAGGAVLISQYWGKGQKDVIKRIMRISMFVATLFSMIVAAICFFFPYQVMRMFTNEIEVLTASANYLKTVSIGYVFFLVSSNYLAGLRAVENVKISTFVYGMSFFVNVFFNYIFIFGKFGAPALGVVGAAMGTVLARIFEFMCIIFYMYFVEKNIGFKIHTIFKVEKELTKDYFKNTIPVVGNQMVWVMGSIATSMIIGHMGSTFVAANSITTGVLGQLAQVFIFGIADASAVICGKTIGTGDLEKAQKTAHTLLVLGIFFGFVSSTIIFLLRRPFLSIYEITPQAKQIAYDMMFMSILTQPFMAIDVVSISGIMRGGGDTKIGLVLDGIGMWFINIPLGILTGFILKVAPKYIFLSMRMDAVAKIFVEIKRIVSGKWIRVVTRDDIL